MQEVHILWISILGRREQAGKRIFKWMIEQNFPDQKDSSLQTNTAHQAPRPVKNTQDLEISEYSEKWEGIS